MYPDSFKIIAQNLRKSGKKFIEIGRLMNVSIHAARGLVVNKRQSMIMKRGPKHKIDGRTSMNIKRCISKLKFSEEKINSTKIKGECNLKVSNKTVQRYLKSKGYIYKNIEKKILLSAKNKYERLRIITGWLARNHSFEKTIFSDEKRFSLDGPDCWRSYIKENDDIVRERRQCQGGDIMMWLMSFPNGLVSYEIIEGYFKSINYKYLLEKRILPTIRLNYGSDFYYQDDNCTVHKAKLVKDFLKEERVNVLEWPYKSPDINIVENIWKMISDEVYDGSSFRTKADLKQKIESVILNINLNRRADVKILYAGIRDRLCTVLKKNGNLFNK